MNTKTLMILSCALFLASYSAAVSYDGLPEDYAACTQGQGKITNTKVVQACTRLIDNSAKENSLVGMFYALRAFANTDKSLNCHDAGKALSLIEDEKLLESVRHLQKTNC